MKISIYALHLGVGGVERYICTIANILSLHHEVKVVSTYKLYENPSFPLSEKVNVQYLSENLKPNAKQFKEALHKKQFLKCFKEGMKSLYILWKRKYINKKALQEEDCDVVISTRNFHNVLIDKYISKNIVKIATEHNHHNNNEKYINEVIGSCKNFDYLLPISKELTLFYEQKMKQYPIQVKFIPFCIDENKEYCHPQFKNRDLVCVGRLSKEKGSVELIDLFHKVHLKDSSIILHIIGDGPENENVKKRIQEYGLEEHVVLHGFQNKEHVYQIVEQCSLYVMTSYTESFGIVLLEAMSCGIPCIAYDSAQGANEIIDNDVDGYLIPSRDEEKMANQILKILNDSDLLLRLSLAGLKKAKDYSYEVTSDKWNLLIDEINKKVRKC